MQIKVLFFVFFLSCSAAALPETLDYKHVVVMEPDFSDCLEIRGGSTKERFYVINDCDADFNVKSILGEEVISVEAGESKGPFGLRQLDSSACISDMCDSSLRVGSPEFQGCVNECLGEKSDYILYGRVGSEDIVIRGEVFEQDSYDNSFLNRSVNLFRLIVFPVVLLVFLGFQLLVFDKNKDLFARHAVRNFIVLFFCVVCLWFLKK